MTNDTLIILILIALCVGTFIAWSYIPAWGYGPGSVLTVLLVVFLVWAVSTGRPPFGAARAGTPTVQDTTDTNATSGNTMEDLKARAQQAGQELKTMGRNAADAIRNAVQGNTTEP